MMGFSVQVLCIGECIFELSEAGEGGLWRATFGGDVLRLAWFLAGQVAQPGAVGFLTMLGQDPLSGQALELMAAAGIDTVSIRRSPQAVPPIAVGARAARGRVAPQWRGPAAARGLADDPAALDDAVAKAGMIVFSATTLAMLSPEPRAVLLAALDRGRRAGRRIVFLASMSPDRWRSAEEMCSAACDGAQRADMVLASPEDEAAAFGVHDPRDVVGRYLALGVHEIVLRGDDGAVTVEAGSLSCRIAAPGQPPAREGGHDAFRAGYLAARLLGAAPDAAAARGEALERTAAGGEAVLSRGQVPPRPAV